MVEDNPAHRDHVDLRDLLRAGPGAHDRYGALKHDFVTELLARARGR